MFRRRFVGAPPADEVQLMPISLRRGFDLRARLSAHSEAIALVGLTLLGCLTAFYELGSRGLWGDEVWQVSWSQQQSPMDTFRRFLAPPDLPVSFLLTQAATSLAPQDPFLARLPSAVFGAAAVPLAYLLGRHVLGPATGVVAAVLLAVAPYHVWYAQDARPYSALAFYALAGLGTFWFLVERATVVRTAGFALAALLGIYNHVFGLFPIAAAFGVGSLAALQWRDHRLALALVAAGVVVIAASLPLAPGIIEFAGAGGPGPFTVAPVEPSLTFLSAVFGALGAGEGPVLVATVALAILGGATIVGRRRWFAILCLAVLLLPLVVVWIVASTHPWATRYVLFMQPIYLLLVAAGIVQAGKVASLFRIDRSAAIVAALTAALSLAALGPTAASYAHSRGTDWTGLCRYLRQHAGPGDVMVGNAYHDGVLPWCLGGMPVSAASPGRYDVGALAASGRGAWYIHVEPGEVESAVAGGPFVEVPRDEWTAPLSPLTATLAKIPTTFDFPVGEWGSRLYRRLPSQPPTRVELHETPGVAVAPNWPDYAQVNPGQRYVVRLSAPLRDGVLRVLRLADQEMEVVVDGEVIGRLGQESGWQWGSLALPPGDGDLVVEVRNAGLGVGAVSVLETRPVRAWP